MYSMKKFGSSFVPFGADLRFRKRTHNIAQTEAEKSDLFGGMQDLAYLSMRDKNGSASGIYYACENHKGF